MSKRSYDEEAINLSKAIDIAIKTFEKFPRENWSKEILNHTISCYNDWKDNVLNPEPKFRKITSLNYIKKDVFTLFDESNGKDVEYFWKQIKEHNLDYKRKDNLGEIISRGKIKNRIEFELVIDMILVAKQEKLITENELNRLNEMISDFELRKSE